MKKILMAGLLGLGMVATTLPVVTIEAQAKSSLAREGWITHKTKLTFKELNSRLNAAIKSNGMLRVTSASASAGAKGRGLTIPGNRIVGVYRNDFAVRMLEASLAAGIEAPIRFYVTEGTDRNARLTYKTPTTVFSPYFEEGGDALKSMAKELDEIFAKIADEAIR
jgi:uncharacterized protein (DUF302 family)